MAEPERRRSAEYGRFLRLPFLLAAPGLPLTGFLLAGGRENVCSLHTFASVCGAAFFSSLFAETGFPSPDGQNLSSGTKKTIRLVSLLLALLFSSVRPETFTVTALIVLTGLAGPKTAAVSFLGAACTALRFVFLTALGMALLPMTGMTSFLPFADFFAAGIFLYVYGLEEARGLRTLRPAVRPGGLPLILGAAICYLTVFFLLGRLTVSGVQAYFCGILAALAAGIFFFLSWKAWRIFRQKSLPGIVRRWTDGLRIGLLSVQSAVAAAAGYWKLSLLLLAACAAARLLLSRLESEAENGA